jgi:NAD kinase
VIVTSPTRYETLVARWGTKGQAKFRMQQAVAHKVAQSSARHTAVNQDESRQADAELEFALFQSEHDQYQATVHQVRASLDFGFPLTMVERRYLPTYEFRNAVVVVVIGPDGLVANTAKYVGDLPMVGINPDPSRIDGVLLPFTVDQVRRAVEGVIKEKANTKSVTLAEAMLNDGQRLLAFNDLFIGRRNHVSARYNLRWRDASESQSSSGVIVATGAGSTGWLSSIFNMARGINSWVGARPINSVKLDWDTRSLAWVVREPFASRYSQAELVAGILDRNETLILESLMPEGGAIFSDGIESDYLEFNSGTTVRIQVADQQAQIVVP